MSINHQRRLTLVAVAVVAALGLAAAVGASIPDGGGVIHGCYNPSGGLRVIDTTSGGKCSPGDKAVNWNVQGPTGPQGPQGQKGDKGDSGPTYAAGTGLGLAGTTFGIDGSYQLPQGCSNGQSPFLLGTPLSHPWSCFTAANANQTCPSGQFQNGVGADGDVTCAAPQDTSTAPEIWMAFGNGDAPQGEATTFATLSIPAGTFLVHGTGNANDDFDGSDQVAMDCEIGTSDPSNSVVATSSVNVQGDTSSAVAANGAWDTGTSFAMQGVVTFSTAGEIDVSCFDLDGSDHVDDVVLAAEKVGVVHGP
jgi:hypothetical protein